MLDVGTGGVDGFLDPVGPGKVEVAYYRGGHGAPLSKDNLPLLAEYVMDGTDKEPRDLVTEQNDAFALLTRASPWLARLLVLLLLAACCWWIMAGPWPLLVNGLALALVLSVLFVALDLV
jgi:hypothetical protein